MSNMALHTPHALLAHAEAWTFEREVHQILPALRTYGGTGDLHADE
jgi:hypothetical protein